MVMRSIRANTKWIMMVMAVAFAGWLVFDWVNQRDQAAGQGANPVIAVVNGQEIRYARWSQALELATDQARAQAGRPLTDEERRQVEDQAWEGMIRDILVEQEIQHLGIQVTDEEVRQAFRLSPPPDLMQHPAFQTNGQFDYAKYQQFFSSPAVDEQLLMQIEAYYRQVLPRTRLTQQIGAGSSVSVAEVWREFRARTETATVTYLTVDPSQVVPAEDVTVSEDEARAWYREHRDDFKRPATAVVDLVSFATTPGSADTVATQARADSLRAAIESGETTFDEVLSAAIADSLQGVSGGRFGRIARGGLSPQLDSVTFGLRSGETSAPVLTPAGFNLLHVSDRTRDSATVAYLRIPVQMTDRSEDELFRRMDRFEGIALQQGIRAAGDSLGVPVRSDVTVSAGSDFVPGAGSLGVGVDWAIDADTPLDEVSEFFQNGGGYHMLEVRSRTEAGIFPFDEVRAQIEQQIATRERRQKAREIAEARLDEIRAAGSLEAAGQELGWPTGTVGPFTRRQPAGALGRGTEAVGAAFGAEIGQIVGPYNAGSTWAILRVDSRTPADTAAFEMARGQIRAQLEMQEAQVNVGGWLQGLRDNAEIVDRRDRLRAQRAG